MKAKPFAQDSSVYRRPISLIIRCLLLSGWFGGIIATGLVTDTHRHVRHWNTTSPSSAKQRQSPTAVRELSQSDTDDLMAVARRVESSVMYVGSPVGDSGTAFVVSKTLRLLATNAHVARIFLETGNMLAVPSDRNGAVYSVIKIFIHNGYSQHKTLNDLASSEVASDSLEGVGPDVALLQLEMNGPELTSECKLAADGELCGIVLQPIGKLGFCSAGRSPTGAVTATLSTGLITRERLIRYGARSDPFEGSLLRWNFLEWSAPGGDGDSGGPVFLANGHVVGIWTWSRQRLGPGGTGYILGGAGIRIDCL